MNILTDKEILKCLSASIGSLAYARAIESAVLSKLAEQDVEQPVAYTCNYAFYRLKPCSSINGQPFIPLYTEAQLLAAQQRTAEACAKAVERLISGDGLCADDGVWIHDCSEAIRNGNWREYL